MSPAKLAAFVPLVSLIASAATGVGCRDKSADQGADGAAATGATAVALPPGVQSARPVCVLRTRAFHARAEHAVRASGTTPPFFWIRPVIGAAPSPRRLSADLDVVADDAVPFALHVVGGGVDLHGLVDRTFPVHAATALALSPFAAALPETELRVVRASSLDLDVEAPVGASVEVVSPPLRTRGPCALFTLDERDFSPLEVIPGAKWKTARNAMLKSGRKIPVTTLPAGEAAARIEVKAPDDPAVIVLEKAVGRAHIAWLGGGLMIHGWIAATDLDPLPPGRRANAAPSASAAPSAVPPDAPPASSPGGPTSAVTPTRAPARGERLTCPAAVRLVAKQGTARATVGELRSPDAFDVVARDQGWAEVRVDVPLVTIAEGARLLVREGDLSACTPAPPR